MGKEFYPATTQQQLPSEGHSFEEGLLANVKVNRNEKANFENSHERMHCFETVTRRRLIFIILVIIIVPLTVITVLVGLLCSREQSHADTCDCSLQQAGVCEVQPLCDDDWIWFRHKCYFFSEEEANWTIANNSCTSLHSFLAVIESKPELEFIFRYKGVYDHWIGLTKRFEEKWKWVNGHEFNNLFAIHESSNCAYINKIEVSSSQCHTRRKWVCTKTI